MGEAIIAPTAVNDTASVACDGSVTIDVLGNDLNSDGDPCYRNLNSFHYSHRMAQLLKTAR